MESEKVKGTLIFQAIGKPAAHLKGAVQEIVDKIREEKGVKLESGEVKEPEEMKEQPGLFSTFAEVNVEVEHAAYMMMLVFKYAPANIEITYPEKITITNNDFSELLSEVARKLHQYDEVARILQMQRQQLEQKVVELGGDLGKPGEGNSVEKKEESGEKEEGEGKKTKSKGKKKVSKKK